MSTPRSIDDIMEEMNDQAKAEGRYLGKAFWEIPPQPGSILDIPETGKSSGDLAWFRARRLERKKTAAEQTELTEELQDQVEATVQSQLQKMALDTSKEHAGHV